MRWFLFFLLLFAARAEAHSVAVNISAFLEGKDLVVLMTGPSGEPINGAKLESILFTSAGQTYRATLTLVADGQYRTAALKAAPGAYTLVLRDTTFPGEALEAQQSVHYPLAQPIRLLLPASKAGAPSVSILIILTLAPIALSLLVMVFILLGRKKPAASLEETP